MTRPSSSGDADRFGPPRGDYARYVQRLSDALMSAKPRQSMVQLTSRPPRSHQAVMAVPNTPTRPKLVRDDDGTSDSKPPTDAEIAALQRALAAQSQPQSAVAPRTASYFLSGTGLALLLYAIFGSGGAGSIFLAIAALYFGSKLRNAA